MYDEDYYERGVETGKSGYQNYRWLPELTIPMAMTFIDFLGLDRNDKILDFGCAKGYVVRALRLLYRQAWGCDVSEYAINSADNCTRQYLELCPEDKIVPFDMDFDVIIAKDIFEHIDEDYIDHMLVELSKKGERMFVIVPLGKDDKFIIPAYEMDITHKLAKDPEWWRNRFEMSGWIVDSFSHYVPGIKESWSNFKGGNGFFLLTRKNELE
jgi:SAM-dependent methyltransferase